MSAIITQLTKNQATIDGSLNSSTVTADADLTQVVTVTTAGTPVQGPDKDNPNGWVLKANPDNTDTVWYMFWGQTKAAKGFPLNAGEAIVVPVRNLNQLGFDADVSGEKIHAAKL